MPETVFSKEISNANAGIPNLANAINVKVKVNVATTPNGVYTGALVLSMGVIPKGSIPIGVLIQGSGLNSASTANVSIGDYDDDEKYVTKKAADEPGFFPFISGVINPDKDTELYAFIDADCTITSEANALVVTVFYTSVK